MTLVSKLIGLIHLLIGLYLINAYFGIISLSFLEGIKEEMIFLAGVIILVHAVIYFLKSPKRIASW